MDILKIPSGSFEEKYLGLPVPEGRMKNDKFVSIKGTYKIKCVTSRRNTYLVQRKKYK